MGLQIFAREIGENSLLESEIERPTSYGETSNEKEIENEVQTFI